MKFLANENFPFPSIQLLRDNGIDVKSIAKDDPGIADKSVVDIADHENRIILTFDKDYGELMFKYRVTSPVPVVFFRYKGDDPYFAGTFLLKLLSDNIVLLENNFTVVEEQNVRQRKYQK